MAEFVVDLFEVIDVRHDHTVGLAALQVPDERAPKRVVDCAAVENPRERIMRGCNLKIFALLD